MHVQILRPFSLDEAPFALVDEPLEDQYVIVEDWRRGPQRIRALLDSHPDVLQVRVETLSGDPVARYMDLTPLR